MKEKKEINIQIGKEIKNVREQIGLTQAEFGELISLDTKNVSDIERGVTGIKISTLKRICENLSISSDTLIFGNQQANDVEYMIERLRHLPAHKYNLIVELINKIIETFVLLDR